MTIKYLQPKYFILSKKKKESSVYILYSSVDGLLNKKDELISIIEKDQPMIIALSEIRPKRQYDFNIAVYNIPGYALFVDNKVKRGVAIYAHVTLNAQLFNTLNDSGFEESVWCQFSTLNNTMVLLGCIYKSPNTTEQNVKIIFSLLELANKSISNND